MAIQNCQQLQEAIQATKPSDTERKRVLIKHAVDLGCTANIPDEWYVEVQNRNRNV